MINYTLSQALSQLTAYYIADRLAGQTPAYGLAKDGQPVRQAALMGVCLLRSGGKLAITGGAARGTLAERENIRDAWLTLINAKATAFLWKEERD